MRFFNALILIASIVAPTSVSAARRCKDSNMPFKHGDDTVTCHDIGDDIPWEVCEDDLVVMSHCPMTCNQCDDYMCVDSEAKMKKGGRKRNGKTFYCAWLDETDDESLDYLCSMKKFQRSCRDACGYCDYTMHFDQVNIPDGDYRQIKTYKQTDITVWNGVVAVAEHYEYYEPELPFAEIAVSKPNFYGSYGSYTAMDCFGGKFDLKSLYVAPLWDFDDEYTAIVFEGYGDEGFQGALEVELETQDTVKFVEFPEANFTGINYLYMFSNSYTYFAMDDIEVKITSPCVYYGDESETSPNPNHATVMEKVSEFPPPVNHYDLQK